jgi:DNA-binding response OmpR family regulator
MRILIVDDDADTRALLCARLRDCAARVDGAADGEAAIAALRCTAYDLVILDLMLPRKNGFEVAAVLDQIDPRPKLVILSALARDFEERFRPGTVVLQKPFDVERLPSVIGSNRGRSPQAEQ